MECPCPIFEAPLTALRSLLPSLRLVQEFIDESGKVLMILIQKPMSGVGVEMQVCISVDQLSPQRDTVLRRDEKVV